MGGEGADTTVTTAEITTGTIMMMSMGIFSKSYATDSSSPSQMLMKRSERTVPTTTGWDSDGTDDVWIPNSGILSNPFSHGEPPFVAPAGTPRVALSRCRVTLIPSEPETPTNHRAGGLKHYLVVISRSESASIRVL